MTAESNALKWAWEQDLPSTPKFVLVGLADYARLQADHTCWPSLETIVERTRLSLRSIQRAIKNLLACNFLRKIGIHKRGTPIYQLAVGEVCRWVEAKPEPRKQLKLFVQRHTVAKPATVSRKKTTVCREAATVCHPTIKNDLTERLTNPPSPPQGGKQLRRDERKRMRETRVERREIGQLFTEALCNTCSTPHPFPHEYFDVQIRHGPCPAFLDSFWEMRRAAASKRAT